MKVENIKRAMELDCELTCIKFMEAVLGERGGDLATIMKEMHSLPHARLDLTNIRKHISAALNERRDEILKEIKTL